MKQDVGTLRTAPSRAPAGVAPPVHGPTLARLLASLGPVRGMEFLVQLRLDLTSARETLGSAADIADRAGLQRATHSLIALAGTAGAAELEQAARDLNVAVHAPDGVDFRDRAASLARMTEGLITDLDALQVRDHPAERPQA